MFESVQTNETLKATPNGMNGMVLTLAHKLNVEYHHGEFHCYA